ncbi:hypothetical protein CCACVL1_27585 [Corchorus capsularis]|uniref:Uncharacterized protein n=1 Tax=Corchorus capsularis TaxID=210143 RepID=A0A1R3G9L4_COCAP|nr:hypothetical protein CCACVL1_27585 [Corchorus capsularis]
MEFAKLLPTLELAARTGRAEGVARERSNIVSIGM